MSASSQRPAPVIFGCAGPTLDAAERDFFRSVDPLGFILFARNCQTPEQVKQLVDDLRASVGRTEVPVLIDQEGGRVARLGPPHWRRPPAAAVFAALYHQNPAKGLEATRLNARLIAHDLTALGIDVDCVPVLDTPVPGAHDIIGDRAYGTEAAQIAALGQAVVDGMAAGGVAPVIKHIPGHGRARADTHVELPVVDASAAELAADFAPFAALKHAPWAMTAHVVYSAFDRTAPATTSAMVIKDVIRGRIGFEGALMSDDLGMQALSGDFATRARASLAAGCDVILHCSGKLEEMQAVQQGLSPMSDAAARRVAAARPAPPLPFDAAAGLARLQELLTA